MPSRRSVALTLLYTLLVALTFVQSIDAHGLAPAHKRHANRDRMLKNRQLNILDPGTVGGESSPPSAPDGGIDNVGSNPGTIVTGSTGTATSSSSATSSATKSSSSISSTSTSSSVNLLSTLVSGLLDGTSTSSSISSSASTTASSTNSSTSASSTSSSSTILSSSTSASTTSATTASETDAVVTQQAGTSTTVLTEGVAAPTASANTTSTDTSDAAKTPSSTVTKDTITSIVAVAASIGAIFLIWTGIRKWKFSPSKDFNDRLQAIDWEPTGHEAGESGVPGHRRVASIASSFRSGENAVGFGGSLSGHANSLAPLPEHDFTAGPANYGAPVGGYADLARGASPQPSMVQRGPSLNHGYGATNY